MDEPDNLPFKVGQFAESKSFEKGYRGAWFRCKIVDISKRKGKIGYLLEFYDFADESAEWTELYQVPGSKARLFTKHLMVRPQYPQMYHEHEVSDIKSFSEVSVVVERSFKVGDLVDWREEDCYWTGRVTKLLDNDKVKIELPMPPAGEGKSYDAFCKDLRPSLDWSPKAGWAVPNLKDGISSCARLIHPTKQDDAAVSNLKNPVTVEVPKDVQAAVRSPLNASVSSHLSAKSLPRPRKLKTRRGPTLKPLNSTVSKDGPVTTIDLDIRELSSHVSANSLPSSSELKTRSGPTLKPLNTTISEDAPVTNMELDAGELSSHVSANSLPSSSELKTRSGAPLSPVRSGALLKKSLKTIVSEDMPVENMDLDVVESASGKAAGSLGSISTTHVRDDDVAETSGNASTEELFEIPLNSMESNTLDAAIMDLEELANKIKWIKAILENGSSTSSELRPAWRFVEHRASSTPD